MTLARLVLRSFQSRPGRALLTLGSIIIGVAGVVSVGLAIRTTRGAYQAMSNALSGRAALEVRGMTGAAFSQDLVSQIASLSGVDAAVPSLQRGGILFHDDRKVKALALGIDPKLDHLVRTYDLVSGKFFDEGQGLVLDSSFARSVGVKDGDEVLLRIGSLKRHKMKVVGLIDPKGVASFAQGATMLLPFAYLQQLVSAQDRVDCVQLVLKADADEKQVQSEVAALLPTGVTVRPPSTRTETDDQTVKSVEQALVVAGTISPVLAAFIIFNTFLMSVSERRKQWATLRAIGATRSQVLQLLMSEGLVLGVAGTLLGMAAGVGGAYLLTRSMESLVQNKLPSVSLTWGPLILGACLGMIVSLTATFIPAWRAGRISPLEGFRAAVGSDSHRIPWWTTLIGLLTLAAGGGIVYAAGQGIFGMRRENLVTGGVVALFAFVLLLPHVLAPAARITGALLAILAPVEAQLAQGQVLRRRLRTTLTAGVLFLAAGWSIGLGATVLDNVRNVQNWLRRTITADFYVRASEPDNQSRVSADVPEALDKEIRGLPGISSVTSALWLRGRVAGQEAQIIVKEFPPQKPLPMFIRVGDPTDVRQRLLEGQVVLGTVLASKIGVKAGDQVTVETPSGDQSLTIAALNNDYTAGGTTMYIERAFGERLMQTHGVTAYAIDALPARLAEVENELNSICQREGLVLQSAASIHRLVNGMMWGVVGGLWVLLALALLVASFGIVNTLTMNVLEQTRELGLLRAVAMTRRQMRSMILCQALIMGLIGLAPGAIAGVLLAYLMNTGSLPMFGRPITFDINPALLVATLAGALLIVILASWAPALRASRMNVITALHQE